MITGVAPLADGAEARARAPAWRIPLVAALAAAFAWFVAHGLRF
jgi:hypothetical protein